MRNIQAGDSSPDEFQSRAQNKRSQYSDKSSRPFCNAVGVTCVPTLACCQCRTLFLTTSRYVQINARHMRRSRRSVWRSYHIRILLTSQDQTTISTKIPNFPSNIGRYKLTNRSSIDSRSSHQTNRPSRKPGRSIRIWIPRPNIGPTTRYQLDKRV